MLNFSVDGCCHGMLLSFTFEPWSERNGFGERVTWDGPASWVSSNFSSTLYILPHSSRQLTSFVHICLFDSASKFKALSDDGGDLCFGVLKARKRASKRINRRERILLVMTMIDGAMARIATDRGL